MRRISIQGSKFTGLDTQSDSTAIDVVIVNAAVVSRAYYKDDYDPSVKRLPTCWSSDTQRPAPEVPRVRDRVRAASTARRMSEALAMEGVGLVGLASV